MNGTKTGRYEGMKKWVLKPCMRRFACMALALAGVWAFGGLLRLGQDGVLLSNSIASILLWWACWKLISEAEKRMDARLLAVCAPLGLMFSAMMVLGANVMQYETAALTAGRTWLSILCAAPLFSSVCAVFIRALRDVRAPRCAGLDCWLNRLSGRTFFALCWALLFVSWLPGLIASYPGVYAYDCPYQLRSYLRGAVNTQHPMAHTGWLALCVVELGALLGSQEAGMCVYSVSQMLLFAAAYASILSFLRRRGAGGTVLACVLALFMLLPANAIFSFSGTKDVAFSAFVIWTLIAMLDAAHAPALLSRRTFWLRFGLSAFGMLIFRNQGVYVFVLAMLIALVVMKGQRRRILALAAALLMLFGVYQGPVTAAVGVQRAHAPQEMLSVPIMQLSRVIRYQPEELSPQDREAIEAFIPDWDNYSSHSCAISDPVKNTFDNARFSADPAAFFKLWGRIGLRHPGTYIDAFLRMTAGYWYPDMAYRDWAAYQPYYQYEYHLAEDAPVLERRTPAALKWLSDWYMELSLNNTDQKIPVLPLFTSAGVAAWIMLLFIGWAVYERRWRMLWPAGLLFGLWGTILLGPVVLMRYALPLIMAEALLAGTVWTSRT